ncbi:hypothetical protein ONS96_006088 [Cadophora gregata f. sp. sojae]|nr:hypothetical protein ONS96_006088 [Cadophora gregata f. sp. sojae]
MLLQADIAREQSGEPTCPIQIEIQPSQRPSQPNVAKPRVLAKGTAARSPYERFSANQRSNPVPLQSRDAASISQTSNETWAPFSAMWPNRSSNDMGEVFLVCY